MAHSISLFVVVAFLGNLPLDEAARDLAISGHFSCALNEDEIKCWGINGVGQLGIGSTTSIYEPPEESFNLGQDFHVTDIDCGYYHCCAVSTAKTSKCWGGGSHGKLGTGSSGNKGDGPNELGDNLPVIDWGTGFEVDSIRCSAVHSCAVSTNNTVKCVGYNNYGSLGYGHRNTIGDESDEMGDNLETVDLGAGFKVASIACGYAFTCALSTDGQVKCWGSQNTAELGQGLSGYVNVGDSSDEMGDNLPFTELGTSFTVSSISCGAVHCCAFSVDKEIKCWGYGLYGNLGYGVAGSVGQYASQMGDNLDTVDLGSFVPEEVVAYDHATIVVSANGTAKAWGYSGDGRTGSESSQSIGDASGEMGDNLPRINLGTGFNATGIAQGFYADHMCVFDGNQPALTAMKCFGYNGYGQLGYGDQSARGAKEGDMGDSLPFVGVGFTASPTTEPSTDPTTAPTTDPSAEPTAEPTPMPSVQPTEEPTRDCSVFHIDEFLMDCSAQFNGHDTDIVGLQDDVLTINSTVAGNVADTAALKVTVSDLVNATATMAEAIAAIHDELALVTEYLDRMGDYP